MDMTSNTSNSSAAASAPHNHQQEAVVSSPARAVVSSPKPRRRQQEPALSCPRCSSDNDTKFCYYNNYKLDRPRYFCKECRRYWTQGSSLRVVPVGGSSRRNKRASGSTSSSAASSTAATSAEMERTFKTRLAAGGSDTGFLPFGPLSLLSEALELELAPGRSETTPILMDILAEGYSDAGGSSSSNYASLAINSGINGKEDMPFLLLMSASYPMETMQLVEGMEDVAGELQWQSYINDDGGYAAAPAAGVEQQQQVPGDQQQGDNNKTKDSSNRGINNSNNSDGVEW